MNEIIDQKEILGLALMEVGARYSDIKQDQRNRMRDRAKNIGKERDHEPIYNRKVK